MTTATSARIPRIAVSGGPGAGKTTLWGLLAEAHAARVVGVPEVATPLFTHVFAGVRDEDERRLVQRAIFAVQTSLEGVHARRARPGQVLLCDRGTPDGAGYWPAGPEAFFDAVGARWDEELARYDAVVFLETAAVGGLAVAGGNNPARSEDVAGAVDVNRRLHEVWRAHPRFNFVPQEADFATKVANGVRVLGSLLDTL